MPELCLRSKLFVALNVAPPVNVMSRNEVHAHVGVPLATEKVAVVPSVAELIFNGLPLVPVQVSVVIVVVTPEVNSTQSGPVRFNVPNVGVPVILKAPPAVADKLRVPVVPPRPKLIKFASVPDPVKVRFTVPLAQLQVRFVVVDMDHNDVLVDVLFIVPVPQVNVRVPVPEPVNCPVDASVSVWPLRFNVPVKAPHVSVVRVGSIVMSTVPPPDEPSKVAVSAAPGAAAAVVPPVAVAQHL